MTQKTADNLCKKRIVYLILGAKEPVHMEHSGSLSVNFKGMSDDELNEFIAEQAGNFSGSAD